MVPRPQSEDVVTTPGNEDEKEYFSPDGSVKLTSGFKVYPTGRDVSMKNPMLWIDGKRKDDNIGDLWRVHDQLYDLSGFMDKHPGGKYWLEVTRGTDITESFVTSHLGPRPQELLHTFYVKEATQPRISPFTFKSDGFYMTIKRKASEILKEKGCGPTMDMYLMQDSMVAFFLFFALMGAWQISVTCILISSVFLSFATAASHNFFHQKDSWRMYIFDLMMFSSREWRVSHVLSHHNFPNTIWDYEIIALEPHLECLAKKNKRFMLRYLVFIPVYLTFLLGHHVDVFRRFLLIALGRIKFHWTFTIIFMQLAIFILLSLSFTKGLGLWLLLHTCSGVIFFQIGLTAAHHHPDIFHEGDVHIKDKDFGLAQVLATRDRGVIMTNLFLTSISFGNHTLHHLFPTVDHSKLPLLIPALLETCQEFGVEFKLMTVWELVKGFYLTQMATETNSKATNLIKKNQIVKSKEE